MKTVLETKNKCRVCDLEAESIVHVEKLPNNGIAINAIHTDGQIHSWSEYSTSSIGSSARNSSKIIICPKCGKKGRVNSFRPYKQKQEYVRYYIRHKQIKGFWGRDKKMQRYERCYINDPVQRTILLKKLGRYIPPPSQ
jgi:hypothetical protein